MSAAIRVSNCSKTYRVYDTPRDRLFEVFGGRPRHQTVTALEGIDFEIDRSETIGIIGQNGAGKSTLLKLVCGVTRPTEGEVHVDGTIASILELGTGFHPEFTGRDNASLNAAIIGLTPTEIEERLPAILEFSELGEFLDRPVKTYSSGMYMRLAFSVAVNADPDVLVIDEALAVGDGHFQKKCVDKIRDFQKRGKTILFCSHALYFVSTLCERTMWLRDGRLEKFGKTIDVVHAYEEYLMDQNRSDPSAQTATLKKPNGRSPVRITSAELFDAHGERTDTFSTGDDLIYRIRIASDDPSIPIHVLAGFDRSADEMQCFAIGTNLDDRDPLTGSNHYELDLRVEDLPLVRGDYDIALFLGDEHGVHIYDRLDTRPAFAVRGAEYEIGMIRARHQWELRSEISEAVGR